MQYANTITSVIAALTIAITLSCNNEPYETGDGDLSYIHADYADITVINHRVTDIITDDDVHLTSATPLETSEDIPTDTLLRRLIHYNMPSASSTVDILKFTPVSIITPHDKAEIENMKTDPVKLTAIWLSRNHHYLNLRLGLMVGNNNGIATSQTLKVICDSTHTENEGAIFLTLYHDQANTPEYYTEEVHLSIPLEKIAIAYSENSGMERQVDTISITANTYSGRITKIFTIK